MELNIAIVDDNSTDVIRLKNFIQTWAAYTENKIEEIISYSSGEEVLKNFEPKKFQIVFMDIIMNKINGVQTAKQLRAEDMNIVIIFMTTSKEYAFDAFPVHPFDYVLKPYTNKDVNKILDEAVRVLSAEDPSVIIKVSHSQYKIPIRLISSLVSKNHNVEINLIDGKCLLSSMTFKEIEKLFADKPNFLSCNRGIIVNMPQISSQGNGVFVMKNGTRYPIRIREKSKITAAFSEYLIMNMRAETLPPRKKTAEDY